MKIDRKKSVGTFLAAALAALAGSQGLRAQDFYENFLWQGAHGATFNNGTARSVAWDQDDWDVQSDTNFGAMAGGGFYTHIEKAYDRSSDGLSDPDSNTVGGDGGPGVGVMYMDGDGKILGARLRNPVLIAPGAPAVVEFRAPIFSSTAHWWEVTIAPSTGILIQPSLTSVPKPGGSGFFPAQDSFNIIARGGEIPCLYEGWGTYMKLKYSLGEAGREPSGQYNADNTALSNFTAIDGAFVPGPLHEMDKLTAWRIEFHPSRIDVFVDKDEDGVMEPAESFPVSIPWSEVYVYLMAVSYSVDHHPQEPCWVGMDRRFGWKDVRISPVKYGRTTAWPKDVGTSRVPRDTGWTRFDVRDNHNVGPAVNGVPQPNPVRNSIEPEGILRVWDIHPPQTRTLTVNIPESLSDVVRAKLVYAVHGVGDWNNTYADGAITAKLNGASLGTLPGRATNRVENVDIYQQRSIDVTVGGPSGLRTGVNTLELTLNPRVEIDRIFFELSHSNANLPALPAAPGAAAVLVGGPRLVTASWTGNGVSDGFIVERSRNGGNFVQVARTGPATLSYADVEVKPGNSYRYRVRAFNRAGPSAPGGLSGDAVTPASGGTPPAAPTGLTGSAPSASQVTLQWQDHASNEDGFIIEVTAGTGHAWSERGRTGVNEITFSQTGLYSGTFKYRVKAYNPNGESTYSNEVSVSVPAQPGPGVPVNAPTNFAGAVVSARQIQLTWQDNATNETGYAVERSFDQVYWYELAAINQANVSAYLDQNLAPSTTHYYKIRAYTHTGTGYEPKSGYSPVVTVVTPPPAASAPINPSNLAAVLAGPTQVNLTWDDNASNEDNFVLERSVNGGPFLTLVSLPANTESHSNGGLPTGVVFSYRVRAVNGAGPSAWSNLAQATTAGTPQPSGGGASSLDALAPQRVLSCGLKDGVNDVLLFAPTDEELTVLDVQGRRRFHAQGVGLSWDGRDAGGRTLPSGVYIARVKSLDGRERTQKILIPK